MTTPNQPTPGGNSPSNPSTTAPVPTQANRPAPGATPPPTPSKQDDAKTTKLTATDTTGEMESSGGGHKSAAYSVDPPRTNVRGNAPIEPKSDSSDRRDASKGDSPDRRDKSKGDGRSDTNSADRSGTKQQGC